MGNIFCVELTQLHTNILPVCTLKDECFIQSWNFKSLNPLSAKFFRENISIYLHFVSYLHIDTTQVVEILPQIRQEPAYAT